MLLGQIFIIFLTLILICLIYWLFKNEGNEIQGAKTVFAKKPIKISKCVTCGNAEHKQVYVTVNPKPSFSFEIASVIFPGANFWSIIGKSVKVAICSSCSKKLNFLRVLLLIFSIFSLVLFYIGFAYNDKDWGPFVLILGFSVFLWPGVYVVLKRRVVRVEVDLSEEGYHYTYSNKISNE